MNAIKVLQLLRQYAKCPKCGSEKIENGHGAIIVDENIFIRSCGCGYHHAVAEDEVKSDDRT